MSVDLERLVQKAEIWQLLFDECPIAIAVFSADMKFFLINPAFTDISGHSSDIIDRDIKEVIPLHYRRSHKKMEKQYASNPQKKVNRHGLSPYLLTKNGIEVPIDIDLSYIRYDSKIYYVAFIRRIV